MSQFPAKGFIPKEAIHDNNPSLLSRSRKTKGRAKIHQIVTVQLGASHKEEVDIGRGAGARELVW